MYLYVGLLIINKYCFQVIFEFNKNGKTLSIDNITGNITALALAMVECPSLFANLLPNCKPVDMKSRRHNSSDVLFK